MSRRSALAAGLVIVLATACGSTVPQQQQRTLATVDGLGAPRSVAAGPTDAAFVGPEGSTDPAPGLPAPGAGSSGTGSGSALAESSERLGPAPLVPGRSAPGVTATEIRVGMTYPKNGTAAESLGVQGVTVGDMRGAEQAMVDDLNRRGGIAGRKVVPVYYAIDAASAETSAQIFQRQCSYFTEDEPVFALIPSGFSELLVQCMLKAGAVVLDIYPSGAGDAVFSRYSAYVAPIGIARERSARALLSALEPQRYFEPWDAVRGAPGVGEVGVGIVTFDDSSSLKAVREVLVPGLRRLGFPPEVAEIAFPQSNAEIANVNAAIQAAVLRFRERGVEHVLLQDQGGLLTLFFIRNAHSQRYLPRYGVTSDNGLQLLLGSGSIEVETANGAVGIGWSPISDLSYGDNPPKGPHSNDARRSCLRVMQRAQLSLTDSGAESTALGICDGLEALRAALQGAQGPVTQAGFVAGVDAVVDTWSPASGVAGRLAPGQHDGVAGYHHYGFVSNCGCMRYVGPLRRSTGP